MFGLVWYGMVWSGLRHHPSEVTMKVSSKSLAVLEKIYSWFSLVRFGLVWYGLVWYGLVWLETTSIQSYCENFIKIQLVLAILEKTASI